MIAVVLLAALLFCCIISLVLCRNDTKGYQPRYKRGQPETDVIYNKTTRKTDGKRE